MHQTKSLYLDLCYQSLAMGTVHCIYLNASNEIAVEAFLAGKINFTQIPELIEETLLKAIATDVSSVDHILEIDILARKETNKIIKKMI